MIYIFKNIIMNVTIIAILSSVVIELTKKSALCETVRIACGMLMIIAVLSPLTSVKIPSFSSLFSMIDDYGISQSNEYVQSENDKLIQQNFKSALEEYVKNITLNQGLTCDVNISLSAENELQQITIITDNIEFEQKNKIIDTIKENLGIDNIIFEESATNDN